MPLTRRGRSREITLPLTHPSIKLLTASCESLSTKMKGRVQGVATNPVIAKPSSFLVKLPGVLIDFFGRTAFKDIRKCGRSRLLLAPKKKFLGSGTKGEVGVGRASRPCICATRALSSMLEDAIPTLGLANSSGLGPQSSS